jgi:hypothetical protein
MKRKRTLDELEAELREAECSSFDGKRRLVADSDDVHADGETWGIVSDHGNVELCHRGKNGRLYMHGGLV